MLSFSDLSNAKLIVEMGGGDGSITQGIVDRLAPDAELLVFEISSSFCEAMKKQFPQENVKIINDSAENIHLYLEGKKVDYILVDALLIQYLLKYQVNDVSEFLEIGNKHIYIYNTK